jgi:outer membrane protein assembly factor BamD (BamD/ComL family)
MTVEKIQTIEKTLFDEGNVLNLVEAERAIEAYRAYVKENHADTLAPYYLFKAIDVSSGTTNPERTLTMIDELIAQYPNYEKAPLALFMKGFIYETQVENLFEAQKSYEEFIKKYPNDPLVGDAIVMINNLGKSPEELIREFEKMNE